MGGTATCKALCVLWSSLSLHLQPWSVCGISSCCCRLIILTFPHALPSHGCKCPLLSLIFPADVPTMTLPASRRHLDLSKLQLATWHMRCNGHLSLLYLNDLSFTRANRGCHILKSSPQVIPFALKPRRASQNQNYI